MIPLVSETSAPPAPIAAGGGVPQLTQSPGTGLDFAGLLDAAMPPPPAPESALLGAAPLAQTAPALPLAAVPGGKTLPVAAGQAGAELPQGAVRTDPASLTVPTPAPIALALPPSSAPAASRGGDATLPEAEDDAATNADADTAEAVVEGATLSAAPPPAVLPEAPGDPAPAVPAPPVPPPTTPVTQTDPADQNAAPDPAMAAATSAVPVPVAAAPVPTATGTTRDIAAARVRAAPVAPPVRSANSALPATAGDDSEAPAAPPAPSPAPSPALAPALAPLLAEPEPSAQTSPAPVTAFAAAPPAPATPMPDRVEAARALAPQLETTIDQVGTLREALRAARPEMTLNHAEFGFVSLRLEATGTADWRAVLASRDPGFVPAIQTALAERAVAAAAGAPDSGPSMGQNGTSDQRYGASPNGGQGGSQPYLGQSGQRDGEAAPDHRRPSTAAALAARADEEGAASSQTGQPRGMFA